MQPVRKADEEVKEEVERERKALVYLLVGLLIVIGAVYLYSSGVLQRAALWEGSDEKSAADEQTTGTADLSQSAASRRSYARAHEPTERRTPESESSSLDAPPKHEERQTQSERSASAEGEAHQPTGRKTGTVEGWQAGSLEAAGSPGGAGSYSVALVARKGISREELRKMARDARTRYTGKAKLVIAVYADTPLGRQLANGSIRNPSPALVQLNRLLLYKVDPIKGEQFDFSPLVGPHSRP